jgi:hypothetical protein
VDATRAALEQLRGTPGVVGAWVGHVSAGLVGSAVPSGYGPAQLMPVLAAARRILSASGGGSLELEFQGGSLQAEEVEDWVLVVLTTSGADRAWVRLSREVARARLREARREGPGRA